MIQTVHEGRPVGSTAQAAASDAIALARGVLSTEQAGLAALSDALDADTSGLGTHFSAAVDRIAASPGRVVVSGIGKSGHVGRKIQATLASTGTPSFFLHPSEASHGDLGMVQKDDIVLMLSHSGETPELADIVAYARRFDIFLMAMTSNAGSTLGRAADLCLCLPVASEACPMGLAPTTSSVMQLALGDALSIALLDRRRFSASDFGVFHPGGHLGASLRSVQALMHRGDAMPLGTAATPLSAVILEMTRKAFGCMGVLDDDGTLIGLITDADLRKAIERDLNHTTAAEVMNPAPMTAAPDILAAEALRLMNQRSRPVTSLFVLDTARRPLGIVHIHDLLRAGVA